MNWNRAYVGVSRYRLTPIERIGTLSQLSTCDILFAVQRKRISNRSDSLCPTVITTKFDTNFGCVLVPQLRLSNTTFPLVTKQAALHLR